MAWLLAFVLGFISVVVLLSIWSALKNPKRNRSGERRHFMLTVVGVSHKNNDGTSRQSIIERCHEGERVRLVADPTNKYDPDAVKVCRMNGEQIGFIGEPDNEHLLKNLATYNAEIAYIRGGEKGKPTRGVVIRLGVPEGLPRASNKKKKLS